MENSRLKGIRAQRMRLIAVNVYLVNIIFLFLPFLDHAA
jgi:hypothetical protein